MSPVEDTPDVELVVRARRAVVGGVVRAAAVVVDTGRITAVLPFEAPVRSRQQILIAEDEVLLPGLVDTHVHVNEPGRTEWEGFASATRAAAAGGVTTMVDMPLNCVPATVDVEALELKRSAAAGQCHVDVAFWGGAVPSNLGSLKSLHDNGVMGFKCFLVDSAVVEFPPLDHLQLRAAMLEVAAFDGLLVVHAEDADTIDSLPPVAGRAYGPFVESRPAEAEDRAVAAVIELSRATGARVHVLHLSSGAAVASIARARREGVRITAETCPHYLTLAAEEVPDGATEFKCCPPIRDAQHQEALWRGLENGAVDVVVSDHSPCPPALKRQAEGDFGAAWGGIASLQLGLPVVWTRARQRGHDLTSVVRWMASGPAALVGLARKGKIAVGCDADLVVIAPDETFVVDPRSLHHRHPITPYAGGELSGVVRKTLLGGRCIDGVPRGRQLTRQARGEP